MSKVILKRSSMFQFKYAIFTVLGAILVGTIVTVSLLVVKEKTTQTVATVNGAPITIKEFKGKLASHRAEIIAYFNHTYQVQQGKDFWVSNYKGEVPSEKLKKRALDACVNIKAKQLLAKENGLIQDISYTKFLKDLKAENERRKEAVKSNKVIYGPKQYGEDNYFTLLLTNMMNELEKKMDGQFTVSEAEIKNHYDNALKKGELKKAGRIRIEKAEIPFNSSDQNSQDEAKRKAEEIRKKFMYGQSMNSLSAMYGENGAIKVVFSEQNFDASTRREDYSPDIYPFTEKAVNVPLGKVSDVFVFSNAYYVVKCVEKEQEGLFALSEVKETIQRTLKEQKFEQYIEGYIKKAKVVINQQVFQTLEIE